MDPEHGEMYFSSWGSEPKIESAKLNGANRKVFIPKIGRVFGLSLDHSARRLYWTDIDSKSIAYSLLEKDYQSVNIIMPSNGNNIFGLAMFKNDLFYADWTKGTIEKVDKITGISKTTIVANAGDVMDLTIFKDLSVNPDVNDNEVFQKNPCEVNNGDCQQLCLYDGKNPKCECSSQHWNDQGVCKEPEDFLIYGHRNKISKLVSPPNDDPKSVPDIVIPVHGAKDIRSLSYDSVTNR